MRLSGSTVVLLSSLLFTFFSVCFLPLAHTHAAVFNVGPGKTYDHISQVPLDQLNPGDTIKVYYRVEPYTEKFIIRRSGTRKAPITIMGIPAGGKRPVIDGSGAVQSQKDFKHDTGRYLIKIGGKSPGDFVVIRNLHLRNANNSQIHLSDEGSIKKYSDNAAGIFVYWGSSVTISSCIIQSCGDGILTNHSPNVKYTTIRNCRFFDNGNFENPASSQEHNVYMQGERSIVEFCHFGSGHSDGQLIKDRSRSTVIRYNWIQGGPNRQLDLVDYKEYEKADAFVYGNVIIQGRKIHNYQMIHFGGDSGHSRSGDLYFFNNTVVSNSAKTIFLQNKSDCTICLINNAFVGKGRLWNNKGRLKGYNNWIYNSIIGTFDWSMCIRGNDPGFLPWFGILYVPSPFNSALTDTGSNLVPLQVKYMPKPFGGGMRRPKYGNMDIGAYESAIHFIKPKKRQ